MFSVLINNGSINFYRVPNFLPLLASRCFLAGLSKKLKEKSLCDLCDSSEAGGESISKQKLTH
jgi:hypothetical protein